MTAPIRLREWERRVVALPAHDAGELRNRYGTVFDVAPAWGRAGEFDVRPRGVIGSIRLRSCHLVIEPKVELNVAMHMLEASISSGRLPTIEPPGVETPHEHLGSVLAHWYVGLVLPVLQRSMLRRYRPFEEPLQAVRGRVAIAGSMRASVRTAPPRLICNFDEFSENTVENQVLRAAAIVLAAFPGLPPRLSFGLRRIDDLLSGADLRIPPRWERERIRLDRLSAAYEHPLALANWVLDRLSPELHAGQAMRQFPAFLVQMHEVFEAFVARRLEDLLPPHGYRVMAQRTWPVDVARQLFTMRMDIDVTSPSGARVVLDTKYKPFDEAYQPAEADIYQLLTYCQVTGASAGYLVYPERTALQQPRTYRIAGIDLPVTLFPVALGQGRVALEGSVSQLAGALKTFTQAP